MFTERDSEYNRRTKITSCYPKFGSLSRKYKIIGDYIDHSLNLIPEFYSS